MGTPTDRDLIQRARRGETEAFGELVMRYQNNVFNVCYRMLHDRAEAEDMAQDSFSGTVPVSALRSIADFHLGGDPRALQQKRVALDTVYAGDVLGKDTLSIMDTLARLDPLTYTPSYSAKYPDTEFGLALKQTAMLIKAEVGLEVSAIDVGGGDTHFAQGSTSGLMPNLMRDLAKGLAAFHADRLDHMNRLTTVTMSQFGRRASENGSLGTDHGHGSMIMMLGGNGSGAKYTAHGPGWGKAG